MPNQPTSNYVLVLDTNRNPVMPCTAKRAHELMAKGRAARYRSHPFTIILNYVPADGRQELTLKVDPGSKHTGMALVVHGAKGPRTIHASILTHRGTEISELLASRAETRRSRRNRNTRYRPKRFDNRRPKGRRSARTMKAKTTRRQIARRLRQANYYERRHKPNPKLSKGRQSDTPRDYNTWLPPSIQARIHQAATWISKYARWSPITSVWIEEVSFDTAKLVHPDKHPQESTTLGFMMRHYLLHIHNHTCQYCHGASKDKRLTWDHIHPRSKGGTNSSTNATLACYTCNQSKGNLSIPEWLSTLRGNSAYIRAIRQHAPKIKGSSGKGRHATAATIISSRLQHIVRAQLQLPLETYPAWLTAANRSACNLHKDHWVDAAMVGYPAITNPNLQPLLIQAKGNKGRQIVNKKDNPPSLSSKLQGFKIWDTIGYTHIKGKRKGTSGVTVISSLRRNPVKLRYYIPRPPPTDPSIPPNPKPLEVAINPSIATRLFMADRYLYSIQTHRAA